jgi:photosystem II stability/assembly factor-like uncharacterized protein
MKSRRDGGRNVSPPLGGDPWDANQSEATMSGLAVIANSMSSNTPAVINASPTGAVWDAGRAMKTFWLRAMVAIVALQSGCAMAAPPALCPSQVPVVTLAPHQAGGFSWGVVKRPMDDPCLSHIAVDPASDSAWYVGGSNGLYMTKDGGQTWTKPLNGPVGVLLLAPGQPELVYVGIVKRLYLSRDRGKSWNLIHTFDHPVSSLLATSTHLYVGLGWTTHAIPSGVYISNLGGGGMQFYPFGPTHTGLIVWTLARDPQDGTLYAGAEIFDHPRPYHPPFFRSTTGGLTWENVVGTLPHHVIAAAVRPGDSHVYALTEGQGLFGSNDKGDTWDPPTNAMGLGASLLLQPAAPTHLFSGRQKVAALNGGIFVSKNAGGVFEPIGLAGVTVGGMAINAAGTRIFATTYGSGIYISPIPASIQ